MTGRDHRRVAQSLKNRRSTKGAVTGAVGGRGISRWFFRSAPLHDTKGKTSRSGAERVLSSKSASAESILVVERRILEMVAQGIRSPKSLIAYADSWRGKPAASSRPSRCWTAIACGMVPRRASQRPIPMRSTAWRLDHRPAPGTAAYRGEPAIVEDIASHPLWSAYCDLALSHSLRACWSTPVSPQGKVIATFAMYYREPRRPTTRDER